MSNTKGKFTFTSCSNSPAKAKSTNFTNKTNKCMNKRNKNAKSFFGRTHDENDDDNDDGLCSMVIINALWTSP